ncbi:hypothetical protein D187_009702 [Cystobacter fuscus DSM 2262]|uniref:Uncharacterized protein n=1 Tax=Cystobacter fuscus (strain ATCC 25194 / DSM 2262 / NBRC 100088 / M29) TaxID=1242864 RepID=S9QF32_CYSF2|nr:hypothetical protein D187_009702 [Cystobacter fuscus DSM 2262]
MIDSGSWAWGVIQGDFNEDPSIGQTIANTIITMIPVVDQAADIRDLTANLKVLIWDEEYDNYAAWTALTLTLIGIIPILGSLLKGICKAIRLGARRVSLKDLSPQHVQDLMGAVNKLDPDLKSRILWYP